MGAYYAMRAIEEYGVLPEIRCVSLISGGSWGFFMWLYEDIPGHAASNIIDFFDVENPKWAREIPKWGPAIEKKRGDWFNAWSHSIQKNIIDMTGPRVGELKLQDIRDRLRHKGLADAKVYFVVQSIDLKASITHRAVHFKDFCWFISSVANNAQKDVFKCMNGFGMEYDIKHVQVNVKKNTKNYRPITLRDILNYCSSAWATRGALAEGHSHTTQKIRASDTEIPDLTKEYRLVDAGAVFNDPLVPFLHNTEIPDTYIVWNFDFSLMKSGESPWGNVKEIMLLNEPKLMRKIFPKHAPHQLKCDNGQGFHALTPQNFEAFHRPVYHCKYANRIIFHYPLYGMVSKHKMIYFFPTREGAGAFQWDMMHFIFFVKEWFPHVKGILQGEGYASRRSLLHERIG
eukprot:504159_1